MTNEITTDAELISRLLTTQPRPAECLVAAARIEQLKAEMVEARERAEKLAEALAFYADLSGDGPWHLPSEDYGKRARSTLAAYQEARK